MKTDNAPQIWLLKKVLPVRAVIGIMNRKRPFTRTRSNAKANTTARDRPSARNALKSKQQIIIQLNETKKT